MWLGSLPRSVLCFAEQTLRAPPLILFQLPVESLNIQALLASSTVVDGCSASPPVLLRSCWEMGARYCRRLLLSCTRVFRALESSTAVCLQRGKQHVHYWPQNYSMACQGSRGDNSQQLTSRKEKSGQVSAGAGPSAPSADSRSVLQQSRLALLWSREES